MAQSARDRTAIGHYLAKHGLGRLEDPGVVAQLAYLVADHAEFGRILNVCEPAERRAMYEAMSPHLTFSARPFDAYLAEIAADAEARQLPVIEADGKVRAFNVAEINTALAQAVANETLILVCRRCTKEAEFFGTDRYEAVRAARHAGWMYCHGDDLSGYEVCPDCSDGGHEG